MTDTLLNIKNLSAWYQKECPVLTELSIKLEEHEIAGLIGLNGAGKTTLLKILSGLHGEFCQEKALFRGRSVNFRDDGFKRSRYTVFAEDHSFGYFTFWEYLSYVSAAYRKKLQDTEVRELMEGFHFEAYADVLLRELSTGNQKKAFLITAFALGPELLLMDEPANGLDFQSTEFLYQQIAGYRKRGAVLFTSHILESITLTADRVLVLEGGQIRREFGKEEMDAARLRKALGGEAASRAEADGAFYQAWEEA